MGARHIVTALHGLIGRGSRRAVKRIDCKTRDQYDRDDHPSKTHRLKRLHARWGTFKLRPKDDFTLDKRACFAYCSDSWTESGVGGETRKGLQPLESIRHVATVSLCFQPPQYKCVYESP